MHRETLDLTSRIRHVARDTSMNQFRNILRFKDVTTHLARLLRTGGIWTLDLEKTFENLLKCRIGQVCCYSHHVSDFILKSKGNGLCDCYMCKPGRSNRILAS